MTTKKDPYPVPKVDVEPLGDGYDGMEDPVPYFVVEMMKREIVAHLESIWKRLDKLEGETDES